MEEQRVSKKKIGNNRGYEEISTSMEIDDDEWGHQHKRAKTK